MLYIKNTELKHMHARAHTRTHTYTHNTFHDSCPLRLDRQEVEFGIRLVYYYVLAALYCKIPWTEIVGHLPPE